MSNDEYDDELSGIFDNLKPEDFTPNQGRAAFDQFTNNLIETTRHAYIASMGQINPIAVLANASEKRTVTPTQTETLGEYVERLGVEARAMGATWFFLSRKTLIGNYLAKAGDDLPDVTDPATVAKAMADGILTEGVFFYAECHEGSERYIRHGQMAAEGPSALGEVIEGNPLAQQGVSFFANVLG